MLHASANQLLDQLKDVILCCKKEDFSKELPELSNSTFGQHVRHTLEFFLCLFDAKNDGLVNYDNRKHDKILESDQKLALSVIDSIQEFLQKQEDDYPITFEANYSLEGGGSSKMKSSFNRELAYNIEHAIHHMALLKVAVSQCLTYIELPEHFGVASSTVRYQAGSDA